MMKDNKVKLYTIIILLFMFQPVIEGLFSAFKYYDEIVVLWFFCCYIISIVRKGNIGKRYAKILLVFVLFCVIGICGNIISRSGQPKAAILQDVFSNGKMILFALSIHNVSLNIRQKRQLEDIVSFLVRLLFVIMFVTAVLSQFVDIGMVAKARYGIKSYRFLFNNPAGLNTYYYLYMILYSITITKNGRIRQHSTFFTAIGVVPWIMTMRSRAIAFAVIYLGLYFYILYFRKPGKAYKFKWYQIILVGIVAIILSWDAIDKYFISNDKVARYNLMHTSFMLAKDFFPIGSGFGSFGTEASRVYYSSIYLRYGISQIYGLNMEHPTYITDQFWFGIIGQFGVLGTFLMAYQIFKIYKDIWMFSKYQKKNQLACVVLFITSLFASLTAGTFIQASIIPSIMIIYLLADNNVDRFLCGR